MKRGCGRTAIGKGRRDRGEKTETDFPGSPASRMAKKSELWLQLLGYDQYINASK